MEEVSPMSTRRVFFVLAVIALLAGCKSSGAAYNPPVSLAPYSNILVSEAGDNTVYTFPLSANGSVAPTATLSGGTTQLNQPEGLFADRAHRTLWAGNYAGGSGGTVTEYSLNGGSGAPIKSIGGATTTLHGPGGIYVDGSGKLYVGDFTNAAVDVFAAGANGDVAPARQISGATTGLTRPTGLWLDSNGDMWVGNVTTGGTTGSVLEFSPNATGDVAPIASLTLPARTYPYGIFVDSHQNVWIADPYNGAVLEYAAGTTAAPARTITGVYEANGVFVDSSGKIYVTNYTNSTNQTAVYVFAANASGAATPIQQIPVNATTQIGDVIGIVLY
jgi:hypothetical protein